MPAKPQIRPTNSLALDYTGQLKVPSSLEFQCIMITHPTLSCQISSAVTASNASCVLALCTVCSSSGLAHELHDAMKVASARFGEAALSRALGPVSARRRD